MDGYGLALHQLSRLESFENVESNLADPPVSMLQDRIRAAGVDPDLWYGLGIVGVWAAIDAFVERMIPEQPKKPKQRQEWLKSRLDTTEYTAFLELDDLRNLFAHNFAGVVDQTYLDHPRRHYLKLGADCKLDCGYQFKGLAGERVALTLAHFKHYIAQARDIVAALR